MKRILYLLFVSFSIFSMQLDIVQFDQKAAAVKSIHKKMCVEPQIESNALGLTEKTALIKNSSKKMFIAPQSVFILNRLGEIELSYGKKGFCVHQGDKKHVIQKYFTDPMVRNITREQLKCFLKVGYLSLNQMDNGDFSLKANGRINGGGAFGAALGAFLGKAAVSVAGHGAIQVIAILTGPGYLPTVIALESCFGAAIETASMAGAVAVGMALGVAEGPI